MASIATGRFGAATLGGELLVVRDGVVGSFGTLQQWLNRKTVSAKMVADTRAQQVRANHDVCRALAYRAELFWAQFQY
jgi:hypothetical protein